MQINKPENRLSAYKGAIYMQIIFLTMQIDSTAKRAGPFQPRQRIGYISSGSLTPVEMRIIELTAATSGKIIQVTAQALVRILIIR